MTTSKFTFDLGASGSTNGITFEAWVDDHCCIRTDDLSTRTLTCDFDDSDEAERTIKLVMRGKTEEHTKIDEQGNIVQDAYIEISNMFLDEIALGFEITDKIVYTHDFNGTKNPVEQKFHGIMGCNGELTLKFRTPVYLWILENL